MLLSIAKIYEMLQFSESKADAHNENISEKTLEQISVLDVIT